VSLRVGIDVGGTFTDLSAFDTESGELSVSKAPSTPDDPIRGVLDVIARASVENRDIADLIHGTTVATNALLERKKRMPGLVTTKGFRDVVFLQRGTRQYLYDLQSDKPIPFVERRHCLEVDERINSRGEIERPLIADDVRAAARSLRHEGVRDIAVSCLFAYLNPSHELLTRELILEEFPEASVSLSHEVYRRWREYDRTSTTLADAFLKTLVSDYVTNLADGLNRAKVEGNFLIMKSNGGVEDHRAAAAKPVDLLVSGPVGGVLSAVYFGQLTGRRNLISMDMGGTSLDVSLITDGQVRQTNEYEIEWGLPVYTPMVDVKTIGAGGGSIAWIDKGGLLRVGPRSAGANPGPVCYGEGGTEPTVTDANLVLGRINPDYFLGGSLKLDFDAAALALKRLGEELGMSLEQVASAVVELVDANMVNAIRVVSIDQGLDPRDFTLISFGGAGSLHAASLARLIGIGEVIAPIHQGVFSALGLTTADMRVDESVTANFRSDRLDLTEVNRVISDLEATALARIREEGFAGKPHVRRAIEMRYYGQNYAVEVEAEIIDGSLNADALAACLDSYHAEHHRLYGYNLPSEVVEFINFTVTATGPTQKPELPARDGAGRANAKTERDVFFRAPGGWLQTPVYERDDLPAGTTLTGPVIVEEPMSTTLVHPGQTLRVDPFGNLVIEVPKKGRDELSD
jgi:N-methylhydantoinase A